MSATRRPMSPLHPRGTYRITYRITYSPGTRTISFSESRANYARTLDSVVDDREEVVVTRSGRESVVIVSLDEYRSLQESAYLLRNPENAARILRSIERLEAGGGTERPLAE